MSGLEGRCSVFELAARNKAQDLRFFFLMSETQKEDLDDSRGLNPQYGRPNRVGHPISRTASYLVFMLAGLRLKWLER